MGNQVISPNFLPWPQRADDLLKFQKMGICWDCSNLDNAPGIYPCHLPDGYGIKSDPNNTHRSMFVNAYPCDNSHDTFYGYVVNAFGNGIGWIMFDKEKSLCDLMFMTRPIFYNLKQIKLENQWIVDNLSNTKVWVENDSIEHQNSKIKKE